MTNLSTLALGLAAFAWTPLLPEAAAAALELQFGASVPPARARAWTRVGERAWESWEKKYGRATGGPVTVEVLPPLRVEGLAGRLRDRRIELNGALGAAAIERTLRHELAHHYLDVVCADRGLEEFPSVQEAFAQWASGDFRARATETKQFLQSSGARDFLRTRVISASLRDKKSQEALSRLLAEPSAEKAWEKYFDRVVAACREARLSPEDAARELVGMLDSPGEKPTTETVDFLLIEGKSQRVLGEEGTPDRAFPPGSVLKPVLVAAVPELLSTRVALPSPSWNCPDYAPGRSWTWQDALAKSCHGFFLEGAADRSVSWKTFDKWLSLAGVKQLPLSMSQRIGVVPGFEVSATQLARLYQITARLAPFVVDALLATARDATLSPAPAAAWFTAHGIALESGSVRTLDNRPEHSWIVAVGPRDESGEPTFVAVIHGTGQSTHALLGELRDRLQVKLRYPPKSASVRVLDLVPSGTVSLSCGDGVPLAVRDAAGRWRPTESAPTTLRADESYQCLGAPLRLTYLRTERRLWGTLQIVAPSAILAGAAPLPPTERQGRTGSAVLLTTTEREYVTGVLLSEFPDGNSEALKALALVVKHNAQVGRHPGPGPVCDTTHCALFGQGDRQPAALRRRIEGIVDSLAEVRVKPGDKPAWLPYFPGGAEKWERRRSGGVIATRLGIAAPVRTIERNGGTLNVVSGTGARLTMTCESLRNRLGLLSCPKEMRREAEEWIFRGEGVSHGEGLPLLRANELAGQGEGYRAILARYFPDVRILGE